jgi:putative acetyltransferase
MYAVSPPESVHALDINKLKQPEITFWTIWEGKDLPSVVLLRIMCWTLIVFL